MTNDPGSAAHGAFDPKRPTTGELIDDLAENLGLVDVIAALAEHTASTPPESIRERLLSSVRDRPRPGDEGLPAHEVYLRRADGLSAVLDELSDLDWTANAKPYSWTVAELMAHLTVVEEYTNRQFRLAPRPESADTGESDHLALGRDVIAELSVGLVEALVERWRNAVDVTRVHVRSDRYNPTADTPLHGWPFDAETALIVRSFEIWTHTDDICRATGRPQRDLSAGELRTMSSASVRSLPALLAMRGIEPPWIRIVLTGAGGGTFDLTPTGSDVDGGRGDQAVGALLVADVVDYCRIVARRLDPPLLDATREGDLALIDELLDAAGSISF